MLGCSSRAIARVSRWKRSIVPAAPAPASRRTSYFGPRALARLGIVESGIGANYATYFLLTPLLETRRADDRAALRSRLRRTAVGRNDGVPNLLPRRSGEDV